MSKLMNEFWFLLGMLLNHCNAALVFFHCCTPVFSTTALLIFSRIDLLTRPNSDFEGFMRQQVGLFAKLSLWSFKVINELFWDNVSNLLVIPNLLAICLASRFIECSVSSGAFLYSFSTNATHLSRHIWTLKENNLNYDLKWRILARANSYSNTNKRCNLCIAEKYFIICKPQLCSLNSRNELVNTCRHARKCCLTNI